MAIFVTGPHLCYECGKDISSPRYWVELLDGGARLRLKDEQAPDESDGGYMGFYPVGSDCARKLRKRGVMVMDEKETTHAT